MSPKVTKMKLKKHKRIIADEVKSVYANGQVFCDACQRDIDNSSTCHSFEMNIILCDFCHDSVERVIEFDLLEE